MRMLNTPPPYEPPPTTTTTSRCSCPRSSKWHSPRAAARRAQRVPAGSSCRRLACPKTAGPWALLKSSSGQVLGIERQRVICSSLQAGLAAFVGVGLGVAVGVGLGVAVKVLRQ